MDLDSPSSISPGVNICRRSGTSNHGACKQPVEPPQPDPARTTTKDSSSVPATKRRVSPLIDGLLHEQYTSSHRATPARRYEMGQHNPTSVRRKRNISHPTVLIVVKSPGVALNIDLPEPLHLKWF